MCPRSSPLPPAATAVGALQSPHEPELPQEQARTAPRRDLGAGHHCINRVDVMAGDMRTTVTLDPDVAALVKRLMADRQLSFKEAINSALRDALNPTSASSAPSLPIYDMGAAKVPLEHALRLAAELEDEEITRKMSVGR
jgi:hypothetical protein